MVPTSTGELRRIGRQDARAGCRRGSRTSSAQSGQLDRRREPLDEDVRDGPRELDRLAEVAAGELAEVEAELDGDRLVEAVALDEVGADRVGRLLAEDRPARVAGDDPGEDEDEEDDPEEDRDRQRAAGGG